MDSVNDKKDKYDKFETIKKEYIKPEITSEPILAFGAVCNGTSKGGRKQATGAPDNCNATKLWS